MQTNPETTSKPGLVTIGTEPIGKKQPWRDILQPNEFVQPEYFKATPIAASTGKVRLLAELDSKSR